MITPRTYKRKGEELEKWAQTKKYEQRKMIIANQSNVKTLIESINKGKESILDKIGQSPRNHNISRDKSHNIQESSSLDYEEVDEM